MKCAFVIFVLAVSMCALGGCASYQWENDSLGGLNKEKMFAIHHGMCTERVALLLSEREALPYIQVASSGAFADAFSKAFKESYERGQRSRSRRRERDKEEAIYNGCMASFGWFYVRQE